VTGVVSAAGDLRYDRGVSMTGVPSTSSGTSTSVSLQAVVEAARRLDELSTARVIGEAADAVHKAQKGGLPLGTLMPQAILVAASGIAIAPPAAPSIAYTAPECLRGQAGDRRSDVFSLGVLLWEALAHERLFDAPTDDARKTAVLEREIQAPSELNANVPAELDAICKKALDRDPANRYHSAKVMAAEISTVLDDAGYPDNNDEIARYLAAVFPGGAPVVPSTIGAAIAAKLAAAPATATAPTRQQINATMHGMAPIREPGASKPEAAAATKPEPAKPEPAKPEPAKPEPAKLEPAKLEPAKPEPAKLQPLPPIVPKTEPVAAPKIDPGKTIPAGSGLSAPDLKKVDAKLDPTKLDPSKTMPGGSGLSASDLKQAQAKAEADAKASPGTKEPERAKNPSSGLSPTAFMKGPSPAAPSALTEAPPPGPAVLGVPSLPDAKPKALIVDEEPKPKALIVDDPKPKASISNAETIATPALAAAAPSGIVGLPAMPPGAERSFDDDFSTNPGSQPHGAVAAATTATTSSAPEAAVDPTAAVSLPRPRSTTRPGTNKEGKEGRDVLAGWGWSTDSHAAIDDGGHYEESPNAGRKRLVIAIGSALGALLLIVVIAMAASGGDDKEKDAPKEEAPIADTSRAAGEPVAKATDPAPSEPMPSTLPAYDTTTTAPASADPPTPTEPAAVEPAAVEPAAVEPAAVEPAKLEAAKAEAAKAEAAKAEAAKAEAAKLEATNAKAAKAEAAKLEAARVETAKLEAANAKAAKAEAAKLEAANAKAAKLEAARLEAANAKAAKVEAANAKAAKAEAAKLEAANAKAAKAEAAKAAKAAKVETAKVDPVKEPKKKDPKKDPKVAKTSAKPIDPYAPEKVADKPKVDPAVAYKQGFQQYVRGDTGGALTTFKGSLAANPSYPPTWRGLGMVYEKMGQKAQAKKSFTRYLQLSPKAADAEQIRGRMERLGT